MSLRPFHLAIPVGDINKAKDFYGSKLGFSEGRSDNQWVDYDFFGHQLVCHIGASNSFTNKVDGKDAYQFLILEFYLNGKSLILLPRN